MLGTDMSGKNYEIEVTRGVTFRCYDIAGYDRLEVAVEEGVITIRQELPHEMTQWQARALAAMLLDAADELEKSTK
jgi:hypothetical protein